MNKDMIVQARKNYNHFTKIKDELLEVRKVLLQSEKTQLVMDYLRVIEQESKKLPTEEEILKNSFYNIKEETDECNIYVFIGAYSCDKNGNAIKQKNYNKATYFIYQNLEKMFSGVIIYPQEQLEFEKDNIILRFNSDENIRDKFYKLQTVYFREYLNNENITQNQVLKKLSQYL